MSIRYLQDLRRTGGAVYVCMEPPAGTTHQRVIRRFDNSFPLDPADPVNATAALLYDGPPCGGAVDWHAVLPGVVHWYGVYYRQAGVWTLALPRSITPTREVYVPSVDSLDVIRERLEVGLNALLLAGVLTHPRDQFLVMNALPPWEDAIFPAVVVQLEQQSPEHQFIGGFIGEEVLEDGAWRTHEGLWSRYSVLCGAWSLNPDERRLLRRALRDTLIANRDVLEAVGIQELDITLADHEGAPSEASPHYLYSTTARISYLAPDVIQRVTPPIADVLSTLTVS